LQLNPDIVEIKQSTSDSIALKKFTGKFAFQPTEIYEAFGNESAVVELLLSIATHIRKSSIEIPKQILLTMISFDNWLMQLKVKNLHCNLLL
jgi:hypothetical protein